MAAAYAALVSLSQIIHQICNPPPNHQFSIPTQQIQSLQQEVSYLIDFLEKISRRRSREIEDLEKRIVDAVHKAEDVIESHVVRQIQAKYQMHGEIKSSSAFSLRSIQNEIRELLPIQKVLKKKAIVEVINKLISIRKEVDEIRDRAGVEDVGSEYTTTPSSSSRSLIGGKNMMIGDKTCVYVRTCFSLDICYCMC